MMEVLLTAVEGREPVRLLQVVLTLALQESTMRGVEADKNGPPHHRVAGCCG